MALDNDVYYATRYLDNIVFLDDVELIAVI